MTGQLTVALGEYDTGWHDPEASLASAARLVGRAVESGAQAVVLPEMATTGFTMDTSQAEAIDGPEVGELQRIARAASAWLIVGVAIRADDAPPRAANASLAIDPSGKIAAVHRKQRLFAYGDEHLHYVPGTTSTIVTIGTVRVALLICYELRFPELFARVAADVDAMVVIANWPAARLEHWDALLRARAIENQCCIIGVNRVGVANGLAYSGGSTAFDPWGERMTGTMAHGTRIITIDAARVAEVRSQYPFLRDRDLAGWSRPAQVAPPQRTDLDAPAHHLTGDGIAPAPRGQRDRSTR